MNLDLPAIAGRASAAREAILCMAASPEGAHLGGAMSSCDIISMLFHGVLRLRSAEPEWPGRDYFVLSKGHASAALYAALAQRGFIEQAELETYARSGGRLGGHPMKRLPGVEFGTGSLGHGLSLGVGMALGARMRGEPNRAFVVLGDGELQEGSVWEAALSAGRFGLGNLFAIVDHNKLQINGPVEDWLPRHALEDRWRSFGWEVHRADGHDLAELADAFEAMAKPRSAPAVLIADSVKGRGIAFMEADKRSHYVQLSLSLLARARASLEAQS